MPARTPAARTQQAPVQCACASDARKRRGPYFGLTYKANGVTVNDKLSPEAAPLYRAAAQLYRKLKTPLNRRRDLEQIEYFCKGTVLKRMMKCGKAQIA